MIGPCMISAILVVKSAVCTLGCCGREKLGGGSEIPPPPHKNKKKKDHSKQEPITRSEHLPCASVTAFSRTNNIIFQGQIQDFF